MTKMVFYSSIDENNLEVTQKKILTFNRKITKFVPTDHCGVFTLYFEGTNETVDIVMEHIDYFTIDMD